MLYFDTSAMVKQYLDEQDSDRYRAVWDYSVGIATSAVAYAEMMAVLHRKRRAGGITEERLRLAIGAFQGDWGRLYQVPVSSQLNPIIDEIVAKHNLRGFDAMHLASALLVDRSRRENATFVCADRPLNEIARIEGLDTFDRPSIK